MPEGHIALVPLLESAAALRGAYDIARAAPRVAYLGAVTGKGGDVERAIGYRWSPSGRRDPGTAFPRPAGRPGGGRALPDRRPVDELGDLEGLRAFAEQNRSLGYEGMMAIHPPSVPVINDVFSPRPEELARYRADGRRAVEEARHAGPGRSPFEGEWWTKAMAAEARGPPQKRRLQ